MKRASAPRRAGSSASICSRTPRASTGACAGGAHRDDERRAIDDRRKDEGRELGIVDDVDRDAARAGRRGDGRVHRALIGGRDHRDGTFEELRGEGGGAVREVAH